MQGVGKEQIYTILGLIFGLALLGYFLYGVSPGWNEAADARGIVFEVLLFLFVFSWNVLILPHWKSNKTLCLGFFMFLIGSFTDVYDEFFLQPRWANMIIEDPTQALGAGLIGWGIWLWIREKNALLDQIRKERDFEASLIPKLSHDLRVPLNNLGGMASLVDEDPKFLADLKWVQDYHSVVWRGTKEMSLLIENILESHRLKSGTVTLKPSRVSIGPLLDEACRDFQYQSKKKEITLVKDNPSEEFVVEADPVKITRIVQNLLANAIKFSPKGGKITLKAKPENGGVTIRVIDEGPGIPADHMSLLMQEAPSPTKTGFQGDDKSYGIGLKIVREFVALHGGRFWIEPNLPTGAQFCFTLPLR